MSVEAKFEFARGNVSENSSTSELGHGSTEEIQQLEAEPVNTVLVDSGMQRTSRLSLGRARQKSGRPYGVASALPSCRTTIRTG